MADLSAETQPVKSSHLPRTDFEWCILDMFNMLVYNRRVQYQVHRPSRVGYMLPMCPIGRDNEYVVYHL